MASPLDLLTPPRCVLCSRAGPLLCPACMLQLPLIGGPLCERCGAPAERPLDACAECRGRRLGFDTARAAMLHDGAGRRLVHALKTGRLRALADHGAGLVTVVVERPDAGGVTWVPPDRWRTIRRGCHPAELIGRALAARWEMPAASLLATTGRRRPQRGLRSAQRRANVRDAFRAGGEPPPSVILVDDVHTTGATLSECATVLRRAGASRVWAVTLARAPGPGVSPIPQIGDVGEVVPM
jgi:predicted amidophosphoribosyltransferase